MPAKVGDIELLSIIFCHLSTFLLQVGFGGKSLLAAIINVAAFGEIFTGCPSGPATVIYFLGISADCKLFKTISCFSFGLCIIDSRILWFNAIESLIFSGETLVATPEGVLEFFLKNNEPKKMIVKDAAAIAR